MTKDNLIKFFFKPNEFLKKNNNFKIFRSIRLQDFEIFNLAPKLVSTSSAWSPDSNTILQIKIDSLVLEESRKFFLEKVGFLENQACAPFESRLEWKEIQNHIRWTAFDMENRVQTRRKNGSKIEILRSWFLKFFDFLTKWFIFQYESNRTFRRLWPIKQPWQYFWVFKRPWFLTRNQKHIKISRNFLQNSNFRTVCTRFFSFRHKLSPALHHFSKIIKKMSFKRLNVEKIQAIYSSKVLLFLK